VRRSTPARRRVSRLGTISGLGKTLGACTIIEDLKCRKVLICCPNTAKAAVWAPELQRFCPWLEVVVLRNTRSQREKDLGYVAQLIAADKPFALVVHYESLAIIDTERKTGWRKLVGAEGFDIVIADEAHRISNVKAKMTRALKRVPTKRKLALSGSIIMNRADELFSVLQWLFPDTYRSKWRDFNDRYLDYVDSTYGKVCVGVRIERLEELRQELGVFLAYRTKEDELDLPRRTDETRLIELTAPQQKAYDDLRDTCMSQLDDGSIITAQDGLVLLGRLRQVATGLDLVSGELVDSSKQDFAVELIQDNPDEPFVVFTWWRASAYSLAKRLDKLGIENYCVTGDTKPALRAEYIKDFQAGQRRVFIGTLSTISESITLHRASNAIVLDRSFNPSVNQQAEDRIYRIGQERPVTITNIVAAGTVDELRVLPILTEKSELRKLILGA
jgi:SNF2 family DNA or RNA helicase